MELAETLRILEDLSCYDDNKTLQKYAKQLIEGITLFDASTNEIIKAKKEYAHTYRWSLPDLYPDRSKCKLELELQFHLNPNDDGFRKADSLGFWVRKRGDGKHKNRIYFMHGAIHDDQGTGENEFTNVWDKGLVNDYICRAVNIIKDWPHINVLSEHKLELID